MDSSAADVPVRCRRDESVLAVDPTSIYIDVYILSI